LSGSGLNVSGFFDYVVNCDKDFLTNQESWKVDGEFRCYGPLDFRVNRLNAFKEMLSNETRKKRVFSRSRGSRKSRKRNVRSV
jgi:hypothetical protein